MLPVDVHQQAAHLFQHRQRNRYAVDAAAAFAGRRQDAFQEEAVLFVNVLFAQHGRHPFVAFRVEHGLHAELFRSRTDEGSRRAPAQHDAEGVNQDGLAGARLAGKDIEARREFDLRVLY